MYGNSMTTLSKTFLRFNFSQMSRLPGSQIFSGTHPQVLIEAARETGSRAVFLLSFIITDLWTPQNVALVFLTPPQSKK